MPIAAILSTDRDETQPLILSLCKPMLIAFNIHNFSALFTHR